MIVLGKPEDTRNVKKSLKNEALNFVCKVWVLPGMLSHQRCNCYNKWAGRFEIREVLVQHGASARHLKLWSSGETIHVVHDLKASQPLLYTRFKDIFEQELDEESMSAGILKATGEDGAGEPSYPQCTLCSYCPGRCRSDAFDRIRAHVNRCHGPEHADQVIASAREKYESLKQKQQEAKTFKCPPILCPICQKTVHGNQTRLAEHQRSKRCKKPNNNGEEGVDNPDSSSAGPSSRSATKRRRMSSRKK